MILSSTENRKDEARLNPGKNHETTNSGLNSFPHNLLSFQKQKSSTPKRIIKRANSNLVSQTVKTTTHECKNEMYAVLHILF